MRAVLDANVLVSALLSPTGAPARIVQAWLDGLFDLVVTPMLLEELERTLGYRKIQERIQTSDAEAFVEWLRRTATLVEDPDEPPPRRSRDPGDDYLLAIAARERLVLVSGDQHLLALEGSLPVFAPASFLELLQLNERPTSG